MLNDVGRAPALRALRSSPWVASRGKLLAAYLLALGGCGDLLGTGSRVIDSDGDGLSDRREQRLGTDPFNFDSDFDGLGDGDEIIAGTSPLARDSDGDGILDGQDELIDPPSPRTGSISSGNDLEPNDTFDEAVSLNNIGSEAVTLEGKIDRRGDVDVFDLGRMERGDRITVDLERRDDRFRASVAIFDGRRSLFHTGLDPFVSGGPSAMGLIEETVRHDSDHYYLAVTHPFDDPAKGAYRLQISIERGQEVPPARSQTVLLDFGGGVLDIPVLGLTRVESFDSERISPIYAGQGEIIMEVIVETVIENFAGLDVIILTSYDTNAMELESFSRLNLGSFSPAALGASQGVDAYNLNCCDDGVVFTESFRPEVFGFHPTPEALGTAIGNVAAHEIGHLLGLYHVIDPAAVMDELSPGVHLLGNQEFKLAPLSPSVFPLGDQNAPLLLTEILGPSKVEQ